MDTNIYCNLCGSLFDYDDPLDRYDYSWLKHFRSIYSSPTEISISGVGLYDESITSRCIAPLEYTARWKDPGYTFPQDDEIGVLDRGPVNGRYGFVFHEACWSMLERSFYPEPVPVARLYEVCRSLPLPLTQWWEGVGWGYTFGGLDCTDHGSFNPRRDWVSSFPLDPKHGLIPWTKNPCAMSKMDILLEETPEDPPQGTCRSWPTSNNDDALSNVPQEIRDIIASLLSTADVLRLRLASKAFVFTFSSQQFWRSRFQRGGERSWFCEIQDLQGFSNWRWLYRRTSPALLSPELLNRRRVSGLIRQVQEILSLVWNESARVSSVIQASSMPWREVSGDLRPRPGDRGFDFHEGCRVFHTKAIHIAEHLAEVSFSILDLNGTKYITGMRVTTDDGTILSIGYSTNKAWCSEPVTKLHGFKIAIGSRGVQGIQVIHGDGTASQWFGSTDRASHTHRLVCSKRIAALEASFDGFKMVRLSVQEAAGPGLVERTHEKSLLHTALWYPNAPPNGLHFSDAHNSNFWPSYAPLRFTHFGGPAGIHLRQVRGIVVRSFIIDFAIRTITVIFEGTVPDRYSRILAGNWSHGPGDDAKEFSIDGPGGEIIKMVRRELRKDSGMYGFEITTNWGRSCRFGLFSEDLPHETLETPVGNTITGFYANFNSANSLAGIGVISEVVSNH